MCIAVGHSAHRLPLNAPTDEHIIPSAIVAEARAAERVTRCSDGGSQASAVSVSCAAVNGTKLAELVSCNALATDRTQFASAFASFFSLFIFISV